MEIDNQFLSKTLTIIGILIMVSSLLLPSDALSFAVLVAGMGIVSGAIAFGEAERQNKENKKWVVLLEKWMSSLRMY